MKKKTYRKTVFAGKDVPVIGLDQGKGILYHGLSTDYCFNLFYEASMNFREGQDYEEQYGAFIQNAGTKKTVRFLHEDSNFWIEGML